MAIRRRFSERIRASIYREPGTTREDEKAAPRLPHSKRVFTGAGRRPVERQSLYGKRAGRHGSGKSMEVVSYGYELPVEKSGSRDVARVEITKTDAYI